MPQVVPDDFKVLFNNVLASQQQSGTSTANADMPRYMAVGSGTTDVAASDTAMEAEINRRLFETAPTQPTPLTTRMTGFWSSTNITGNTISEIGVLTGSPGGTLAGHANFDGFLKTGSIEFQVVTTYRIA